MVVNRINLFEELDDFSDIDNELDNKSEKNKYDGKLFNPVEKACVNDDLEYLKEYLTNIKLNKKSKIKFLVNLFDISCNYSSLSSMNYLAVFIDKNKISEYIVNNIDYYLYDTNEQILKFFIEFDLNLINNNSIFENEKMNKIFKSFCELGMLELVKLMCENYEPIKNIFNNNYSKLQMYMGQTILRGKFNILDYLCEFSDKYNSNLPTVKKEIILDKNIDDKFISYLNSLLEKDNLDNKIFIEISNELTKEHVFTKFNYLLVKLLIWLSNNLFYDEFKEILKTNINKIIKVKKYLWFHDYKIIMNMLFDVFKRNSNTNPNQIIIENNDVIPERIYLFNWMLELFYCNDSIDSIDMSEYIINFVISNIKKISAYSDSYVFIKELIDKFKINTNKNNYKNMVKYFCDTNNLELIKLVYNNVLEPFEINVILEFIKIASKETIYTRYDVNNISEPIKMKLTWLLKQIDLDNLINIFTANETNQVNNKIITIKDIDTIFLANAKIRNFDDLQKITNLLPDRYYYRLETNGILFFRILDGIRQSPIKQINWSKSCIYKCGICFDDNPDIIINCFHLYCKDCIFYWYNTNKSCPYCKEQITTWTKLNIIDETKNELVIKNNQYNNQNILNV